MADNTVRTYDPKKVVVTFGTTTITGYAEGTFISIERAGDIFSTVKGADGGVDRVNNNNNIFTVEITLKQTSPTNEELTTLSIADALANAGVFQLAIKDLRTSRTAEITGIDGIDKAVFVAAQAWIQKDPDTEYSDAMSNRTWTFSCVGVKLDSGNTGQPSVAAA